VRIRVEEGSNHGLLVNKLVHGRMCHGGGELGDGGAEALKGTIDRRKMKMHF